MRKILALCLSFLLLCALLPTTFAVSEAQDAAERLYDLGLFRGAGTLPDGSPDFQLSRSANRYEAVVMLVRLLGKETAATAGRWVLPFTDVEDWAQPYVGYAYTYGLTEGIGGGKFAGDTLVTAAQYLTFVLRALGYESGRDFQWDRSWELTNKLGITAGDFSGGTFLRGDMAEISLSALSAYRRGGQERLIDFLGIGGGDIPAQPEDVPAPDSDQYAAAVLYENGDYYWHMSSPLYNTGREPWTLRSLRIRLYTGGAEGVLVKEQQYQQGNLPSMDPRVAYGKDLVLSPGQRVSWTDWHPVVAGMDTAVYDFYFMDESGRETVQSYCFRLDAVTPHSTAADYTGDHGQDLLTLRHQADYAQPVAEGVYWVPARALGRSDYTNAQIQALLTSTPEQKQAKIDSLYEALQLYQIGGYAAASNDLRRSADGREWVTPLTGRETVAGNQGSGGASANWLRYLLDDDYEELGYLSVVQSNGRLFTINYILEDGWYYFIDMTHYRADWVDTAVEDGNLEHHQNVVQRHIHKTRDIGVYVQYLLSNMSSIPELVLSYQAENVLPVSTQRMNHHIVVSFEESAMTRQTIWLRQENTGLVLEYVPAS